MPLRPVATAVPCASRVAARRGNSLRSNTPRLHRGAPAMLGTLYGSGMSIKIQRQRQRQRQRRPITVAATLVALAVLPGSVVYWGAWRGGFLLEVLANGIGQAGIGEFAHVGSAQPAVGVVEKSRGQAAGTGLRHGL